MILCLARFPSHHGSSFERPNVNSSYLLFIAICLLCGCALGMCSLIPWDSHSDAKLYDSWSLTWFRLRSTGQVEVSLGSLGRCYQFVIWLARISPFGFRDHIFPICSIWDLKLKVATPSWWLSQHRCRCRKVPYSKRAVQILPKSHPCCISLTRNPTLFRIASVQWRREIQRLGMIFEIQRSNVVFSSDDNNTQRRWFAKGELFKWQQHAIYLYSGFCVWKLSAWAMVETKKYSIRRPTVWESWYRELSSSYRDSLRPHCSEGLFVTCWLTSRLQGIES